MAGGWTGFTDEDLRRLKTQKEKDSSSVNMAKGKTTRMQKMKTPDRRPATSAAVGAPPSPSSTFGQRPLPTSQPIPNQYASNKIPRERVQTDAVSESKISSSDASDISIVKEEPREMDEKEGLSRELGCLEKFREQQKQIEEANKEKKKLLAKTLSERQRKAREEAEKLTHIQKELTILDNLLSADVTVIRDKIEVASRDFMDAQRRYDRAEREFIEAKLDLQKKSELKEQLTEHLYTIIHQNEVRKANKLSELMNKLEMEQNSEGVNLHMGTLPPLSSFNTINSLQTLHSPKSPPAVSPTPVSPKDNVLTSVSPKDNVPTSVSPKDSVPTPVSPKDNVPTPVSAKENHSQDKDIISDHTAKTTKTSNEKDSWEESSSKQSLNINTELPSSTVVISDPEVVTENLESSDPAGNNVEKSNQDTVTRTDTSFENSDSNVFNKADSEETRNLPSSWTLNLVDIKQEPDT